MAPAAGPGPAELGATLRATRESFGWTAADVAAALRLDPALLAALEEGRTDAFPAPVYAIGHARAYASLLGLDPDAAAACLKEPAAAGRPRAAPPADAASPRRRPRPLAPLLTGAGLILAVTAGIAGLAAWLHPRPAVVASAGRTGRLPAGSAPMSPSAIPSTTPPAAGPGTTIAPSAPVSVPSAPAAAPSMGSSPRGQWPGAPVPPAEPPAPASPSVAATEPGRVSLRARSRVWIQVRDGQDGPVLIERELAAGESWAAPDRPGLRLSTRNASALEVLVDGRPVPDLPAVPAAQRGVPLEPDFLRAGPLPPPPPPAPLPSPRR